MSQASDTGSGDDLQATMEAILQRLFKLDMIEKRISALEAKLPELQPLQDQVTLLEETVTEQGEQQRTLHAAIDRVEREQGHQHQELHAAIDRVTVAQRNLGQANQGRRRVGDDGADTSDRAFLPTTHKLEFSKFDGTSDPLPWLNRCERYFLVRRTPEHQRVAFAAFYPLDDAQLWFHRLELNDGRTWPQFIQLVNALFGPPLPDSPVGALAMLWRSGSVDDYAKQFMALSCRDTSLTEPLQVQLFIIGLGDPLRTDVALQQPASLDDAVIFARAYEQRNISRDVPPTAARSTPRSLYRSAPASTLLSVAVGLATSTNQRPQSACRLWRSPSTARMASASIVTSSSSTDTKNTANTSSASKRCLMRSVSAIHRMAASQPSPSMPSPGSSHELGGLCTSTCT
jgi:hypothetical protein